MNTKKQLFALLVMIFFLTLSGSCQKNDHSAPGTLDRLNWSERNYRVLNQLIADYGTTGPHYNKLSPPYAVFDWDQTCAHFDVEEAMMRYQMFHLLFKLTKEQFKDLLKDNINGVTEISAENQKVKLTDLNTDLSSDYNFLYNNFSGMGGIMNLAEIQKTNQYKDFIAKLSFLSEGYSATSGIGIEYSYAWVLYLFAGYTTDEVKSMAREAVSYELANQLSKQTLQSPAGFQSKAGVVSSSYHSGLRVFSEMQNLFATLMKNGIEVFIVSASFKPVVEVFSGIGAFGYNLPSANVIGMELATTTDGRLLPEYKAGWVKTVRHGKVEAINRVIKQGLGRTSDPVFAAGDSDGDYEMFTEFPGMKLSLIWNRVKGGDIGRLCKQAVDEMNSPNPRYILQGRNENTGVAMPGSASILFGKSEPQLLP